ncbi:phage tail protein [Dyadobacter chenwenxiniae]|uniref:Phage tail protein n=1 Tax=Dyadobacter chenwenxiniae TaxID=2906456 RepID=A0A9X1TBL4_9BACT|nr:phage tail tube protein [Dyadobacter chenwenxiniae]MCF0059936.1 phage tail protein [Dyadobacter chenwenxiniae]UON85675.1 phage tail protein [Dyadobacter chenwenxiniae]
MAKFNGSDFKASITGSPNKAIADSRDLTVSISVATIDVSTRDSLGWRELIGGQRSWTAQLSGVVDYTEGTNEVGVASLVELEVLRAPIDLLFGNTVTGSQTYAGKGIITSVETSAPYEDAVEWTASIEGTGPVVLADMA